MPSISPRLILLALSTAPLIAPSLPAQGVERVSLDASGGDSDGASESRSISADGRYVAFASVASDLVAGDGNGLSDIFVRDRVTGTTVRASVDTAGGDADGDSIAPALSGDGQFVAFASTATDLVAGDGNGFQDVFLRDLVAGTTIRISVDMSGGDSDDSSSAPWLDLDGDVVAFASLATDFVTLDKNKHQDIFVRDVASGTTTRVSVDSAGLEANQRSIRPTVSHDGMVVAFSSSADNLIIGDGNNKADVFVHDRNTATTVRASVNDAGTGGIGASGDPEISGDGTKVVFDSFASNLVSGDLNNQQDVFLRDLAAGTTVRISVDSAGLEADDDSFEASTNFDGSVVTFTSLAENLVGDTDTNDLADVYARHVAVGLTRRLSLSNAGTEPDDWCNQSSISSDGQVVCFQSPSGVLDPNDGNGYVDVFEHATCEILFTEFGTGHPGAGGIVPHLFGGNGSGFHGASVHVEDGVGFAHGLLWVGLGTSTVKVFGGNFYVDLSQFFVPIPILLDGVVGQPGDGSLDFEAGDLSAFLGFSAYIQVMLLDSAASKGISMSNALEMEFVAR